MSGLAVRELAVAYGARANFRLVVSGVSLDLRPGELLALAGESGCGKSTTALLSIGYVPQGATRTAGRACLDGVDLLALSRSRVREVWGRRVAYVAQDAAGALSPLRRVGWLLREPLRTHIGLRGKAADDRAAELLRDVGIPEPQVALRRYPHEFSGGQQQRIALAIAIACAPDVLILDEPTTGLDVTTQARVAGLVRRLVAEQSIAGLFVSHDLALLSGVCDRIAVMYGGEVVEAGSVAAVLARPRHPYTRALLDSAPRIDDRAVASGIEGLPPASVAESSCPFAPRCRHVRAICRNQHPPLEDADLEHRVRCVRTGELGVLAPDRRLVSRVAAPDGTTPATRVRPLLEVSELTCAYGSGEAVVRGVSFGLAPGEVLGVVGESGSGKSTLLRAIAGLRAPVEGAMHYAGVRLAARAGQRSGEQRQAIQLVFQHPDSSLNPRHTIERTLARPLQLFAPDLRGRERRERVLELLATVRLDAAILPRLPGELSGGQKQRVALARALAAGPSVLLCDEVVSALDVSVQASILVLLGDLVRERGVAVVFVTHDLAVVRAVADRLVVMREGAFVESGETASVFATPQHAYTRALVAAAPSLGS
jgi:peptide/nickel transport system ATP-binding protein